MSQDNASNYTSMLLTFLAGAAVGAVVVSLTTPKSGPDLRSDIKDLARKAKLRASDLADDASGAWDGMTERTALAAADIKRGFKDAANDLRNPVA